VLVKNILENAYKYSTENTQIEVSQNNSILIVSNVFDGTLDTASISTLFEPFSGTPGS